MGTHVWHRFGGAATVALAVAFLAGCGGSPQDVPDDTKEPNSKAGSGGDEPSVDPGASEPEPATDDVRALWSNSAGQYVEGTTIDINCPEGGYLDASVWGGDNGIYTDDSAICVAAVHAGLITVEEGGTVVIEKTAGEDDYGAGFAANGVTSLPWQEPWTGSFIFS